MLRLRFRTIPAALAALGLTILLQSAAQADPMAPVTVVPAPDEQGESFSPGVRLVSELAHDYVEEEYFVSGGADLYNYSHNPPFGPTDLSAIENDVPYQTRMIIRRPVSDAEFNGMLVIEWWNSTAGFDTAPSWDASAEYFAREGIIYVGVTNSTTSLDFLVGGCSVFGILPQTCGTRYAALSLPENGLAYDMMSQIANLLKSDSPANPLPAEFQVDRLYHAGQSQQGGSIVTYASAFDSVVNDGYFVQQAASARPINFGPVCSAPGSPPLGPIFPDCTPRLQGTDALVRTDLDSPVVHAITETDIEILFGTVARQPDTPTFRYYEVAGGGHLTVHNNVEIVPAGLLGPEPIYLDDLCEFPLNTTADGPVFFSYTLNALWANLDRQVRHGRYSRHGRHGRRGRHGHHGHHGRHGRHDLDDRDDTDGRRQYGRHDRNDRSDRSDRPDRPDRGDRDDRPPGHDRWRWQPPAGVIMQTNAAGEVERDVFGNGLGGLRSAAMDVPVATYLPGNVADPSQPALLQGIGNLACRLASSVDPFDDATIDSLYRDHRQYVRKVIRSVREQRRLGFLLREDAAKVVVNAAASPVACGLGFELVFVVAPIMGLRRRARHGLP
jgi:hypothetical protein